MVWQTEWFANKAGTAIGTLAVGKADEGWNHAVLGRDKTRNVLVDEPEPGWNYAVLGRDKTGDFRVYKLGGDAFSLDDARAEFLLEMALAEKSRAGEYEKEERASP